MTVANLTVAEDRIRLVGDTCAYLSKEPVWFHRKVSIAPDAPVAFTVRGMCLVHDGLRYVADQWRDFAGAVAMVADLLPDTPDDLIGQGCEVTLMGWDDGPRAVRLLLKPGCSVERFDMPPGVYLAPNLGKHEIPVDLSEEQLVKIAHLQQELSRKHGLNICVGGDIELTEVTAAGIETRKIGEYPDKAMMAARIARNGYDAADTLAVA